MRSLTPWNRHYDNASLQTATPLVRMRSDWDQVFGRLLDDAWAPRGTRSAQLPLDVSETEEHVRVRVELPGVEPDAIEVHLQEDVLTISGQKTDSSEGEKDGALYSERTFGSFERSIRLQHSVDPNDVEAKHANGVLTVTLRKSEKTRRRRIDVSAS